MRINSAEVKTYYEIEFTFGEFLDAIGRPSLRYGHEHAFEGLPTEYTDETADELRRGFEAMSFEAHGDTFAALAYFFGFDGWKHCGRYIPARDTHTLTVYRDGADEFCPSLTAGR